MTRTLSRWSVIAALCSALGCGGDATGPSLGEADLRILFLGNSLTYTNDLPGLVETVAEVAGHDVETLSIAHPNYGLGDHWVTGAPQVIREVRPDIVILQQGPSTLSSSRAYLLQWADSLARVAREVGARPALLMVWPPDDPRYTFDAVRSSYRAAAEAVNGMFIPAGSAWLEAWEADEQFALYGPDRFHPAPLGSIVAALTVVATLFDGSLVGLPARMIPTDRSRPDIVLSAGEVEVLYPAVDRAVAELAIR